MKLYENSFDALYDAHPTRDEPASQEVNVMITYQNVLRKAGLAPPRRRGWKRSRKVLVAVAVTAAAALAVAATTYSVSDAFRGSLDLHDSARPVSTGEPIIDRTGVVVNETEESGEVEVSLRAALNDGRSLRVLVDVVDRSGEGLAIRQADGSLSEGYFSLGEYRIERADGRPFSGGAGYDFLEQDATGSRFTILLSYHLMGDTIDGQTLKLHLADILQYADLEGTAFAMEPDALYDIVSQFGPYDQSDFRISDHGPQGAGYQLNVTNSATSVAFSDDVPDVKITAAAVQNRALYLQGISGSEIQLDQVMDNAVLVNDAGNRIQATAAGRSDNGNWTLRFDGVDSIQALKGYVWRHGAGENVHVAHAGSWDFTFQPDVEDLAVKLAPNLTVNWEGYQLTITDLELSPYSVYLGYVVDESTALRMFPRAEWGTSITSDWVESQRIILIHMQDGSTVKAQGGSLSSKDGSGGSPGEVITTYESLYSIDAVIDPAQIASVTIGDSTIAVSE